MPKTSKKKSKSDKVKVSSKKSSEGERRPKKKKSPTSDVTSISVTKPKARVPAESHAWYKATFEKLEFGPGRYDNEFARYQFKLKNGYREDEESAKGMLVSAMCNKDFSPGAKCYEYLCAIIGVELTEDDDSVDVSAHYGDVYEVFIQNDTKGEKTYSNVTKVRAPKVRKKKSKKSKK